MWNRTAVHTHCRQRHSDWHALQRSMMDGAMTTFNSQTNVDQDLGESLSEEDANAVPSDLSEALVEDLPMMQLLSPSKECTDPSNPFDF